MNSCALTETAVLTALSNVWDPELGCDVVDLGLIYSVDIAGAAVTVVMTLTSSGCPMQESLAAGVRNAILALDGVTDALVEIVFDPPWSPAMMTDTGRAQCGIAQA